MKQETRRPSTRKVRRDYAGGKRGNGQVQRRRVRRPDPGTLRTGKADPNLTAVAGLVPYAKWLRDIGLDRELSVRFRGLKEDPRVVYPMQTQMRLLMDAFAVGETRVFGLEALAADPLFVRLAGGVVPSIDTVYSDLERFDDNALEALEAMGAMQGLVSANRLRGWVHMDLDTSVCPHDGEEMEGAVPGPNPKYHGRPSHHPMLARIAQTDTLVGMQLRPGDRGLGAADVGTIEKWVRRAKAALRKDALLCVRIDAGGDAADILECLHRAEAFYLVKGRQTPDLFAAIAGQEHWKTVDRDADGKPIRQVAELSFQRGSWVARGLRVRVIAVRSLERQGRQLVLPAPFDMEWTVQVFLTNRLDDANDIAWDYDARAGIEPLIAELKGAWGIGHSSSYSFRANHAVLLLKALSHNLLTRYARERFPNLPVWRTPWRRRLLLRAPGRLSRSGRRTYLHVLPSSPIARVLIE